MSRKRIPIWRKDQRLERLSDLDPIVRHMGCSEYNRYPLSLQNEITVLSTDVGAGFHTIQINGIIDAKLKAERAKEGTE